MIKVTKIVVDCVKIRVMKYLKLEEYITKYAEKLRVDAEISGYFNDGGQRKLLDKLDKYFMRLVIEKDLRPSEWYLIDQIEVGEPKEFETELNNIKASLIKDIKL